MKNVTISFSVLTTTILLSLSGCSEQATQQTSQNNTIVSPTTDKNTSSKQPTQTNNEKTSKAFPDRVYWGDQHIHTAWSFDAGISGSKLTPEDAIRFVRGEQVNAENGSKAQLSRPLDWAAITDHSDGMGVFNELESANPEMMQDPTAARWSKMMSQGPDKGREAKVEVVDAQSRQVLPKIVTDPKWMVSAWQKTVDIMEKYNEPGKFTAFIGYEWTSNSDNGDNLHRNVIFRDGADKTRAHPPLTTFISADPTVASVDPQSLWTWMAKWEEKTGGQVFAIPHNGNMSNGRMFELQRYNGEPITQKWAETRARWEPLYEVFQYKGQSEAHPALSPNDEYANYGLWDTANLNGVEKKKGMINAEYAREALKNGLMIEQKTGANPFKIGLVAGTDTHNAMSSGGEEDNFYGKFVSTEPKAGRWKSIYKNEGSFVRHDWTLLAAGVTGVWATENTRAALWDAMKRKEVYASSGPRISVRFFAGYNFTAADAHADTLAENGYAKGVPMGGNLPPAKGSEVPTFIFAAMKDPQNANLDSMQIIKGWVDQSGQTHEKVFNVAWSAKDKRKEVDGKLTSVGNTVDLTTATYTNTIGESMFLGQFTDPEFDPKQRAFYYARVVEIPTPRWTAYDAVRFNDKMTDDVKMIHQERAVTSPIWYTPH